jgi:hypothetical protein
MHFLGERFRIPIEEATIDRFAGNWGTVVKNNEHQGHCCVRVRQILP